MAGSLKEVACHPEYGIDPEDTSYSGSWNGIVADHPNQADGGVCLSLRRWASLPMGCCTPMAQEDRLLFFPAEQQFNSTLRLSKLQKGHWLDEKNLVCDSGTDHLQCRHQSPLQRLGHLRGLSVRCCEHEPACALLLISLISTENTQPTQQKTTCTWPSSFSSLPTLLTGYVITQERTAYVQSVYNLLNFALKCIFYVDLVLFFRKHFLAISVVRACPTCQIQFSFPFTQWLKWITP